MTRIASITFLLFIALAATAATRLAAQPFQVKCGSELIMHQSLSTLGRNITCVARFDVIRETPCNIEVTPSDSLGGAGLLIDQTIANLHRLAFKRDTFGLRVVFRYIIDPLVSRHYYTFAGSDTIVIVTPAAPPTIRPCHTEGRSIDVAKGTLTLDGTVFTREAGVPSTISVERIFELADGNTLILENNYPQQEAEIRRAAGYYDLDRFRGAVKGLDEATFARLRYIVRFRVVRLRPDGRGYDVY